MAAANINAPINAEGRTQLYNAVLNKKLEKCEIYHIRSYLNPIELENYDFFIQNSKKKWLLTPENILKNFQYFIDTYGPFIKEFIYQYEGNIFTIPDKELYNIFIENGMEAVRLKRFARELEWFCENHRPNEKPEKDILKEVIINKYKEIKKLLEKYT
jgi:hypothetical protein